MTTAPPNVQPPADHDGHDHDRGLAFDLSTLLNRRRMLQLIGGAGVLALAGCASSATGASDTTAAASASSSGRPRPRLQAPRTRAVPPAAPSG